MLHINKLECFEPNLILLMKNTYTVVHYVVLHCRYDYETVDEAKLVQEEKHSSLSCPSVRDEEMIFQNTETQSALASGQRYSNVSLFGTTF
jgi:hypothetical protein